MAARAPHRGSVCRRGERARRLGQGLVANIASFNVGVEIGQMIALTGVLIALSYWRTRRGFLRHAFVTNGVLMAAGFLLVGYQLSGYFLGA